MFSKPELRKKMRAQRKQLSRGVVSTLSTEIAEKIITLPVFLKSQHVGFYVAQENEVDLSIIFHKALAMNKLLYLPAFSENNAQCLSFYKIDRQTSYMKNQFEINEPVVTHQAPIEPHTLDLIFLPLVGFDTSGNRLGRGAGCYDQYLQFTLQTPRDQRPALIGLAYEFQKIESIISDEWDVPMDYIVTEKELYERKI